MDAKRQFRKRRAKVNRHAMSAIGPKRTSVFAPHMSAVGGKADVVSSSNLVNSTPNYKAPVIKKANNTARRFTDYCAWKAGTTNRLSAPAASSS
jgi:hypothetical protein